MPLHTNAVRFVLAVLLAAGLSGEASAQAVRIGGLVKDDRGGAIRRATVVAENVDFGISFSATTDERGRFTIVGLRPGNWRFTAQAPGHAPKAGEMRLRIGAPNPPVMFELRRTGPEATGALAGIAANDLQVELAAADTLFKQQKWDASIAAYRKILARTPALPVINLQIAAAYRHLKNFQAALDAYAALLKIDLNNQKAQIGIAHTHLERGDPGAAEAALQTAAEEPEAGREVFFNLGDVKAAAGRAEEAATWYEKASAADPSWGRPLHRLGMLALEKGDTPGAEKYLTRVIAVAPTSAEAAMARTTLDQLKK